MAVHEPPPRLLLSVLLRIVASLSYLALHGHHQCRCAGARSAHAGRDSITGGGARVSRAREAAWGLLSKVAGNIGIGASEAGTMPPRGGDAAVSTAPAGGADFPDVRVRPHVLIVSPRHVALAPAGPPHAVSRASVGAPGGSPDGIREGPASAPGARRFSAIAAGGNTAGSATGGAAAAAGRGSGPGGMPVPSHHHSISMPGLLGRSATVSSAIGTTGAHGGSPPAPPPRGAATATVLATSSGPGGAPLQPAVELEPCPVHTPLLVPLTLTNQGRQKAMVTVRPLQSFPDGSACYMCVDNPTLIVRKGETATVFVRLQMLRPGARVDAFVAVEVAGGARLMVLVRAEAEVTVFGVRLADVAATSSGRHANIPVPLALLRERLLLNDGAALREEGIFRVAPGAEEVRRLRAALNVGAFHPAAAAASGGCTGVAAAHMIKLFLRELPQPILSAIPTEVLLATSTEEECAAALKRLLPPASTVLDWLVDLCAEVVAREAENRMGPKNLAICLGPNLFVTDESVNPMEALMTSQKAANLLHKVIAARVRDGIGGTGGSGENRAAAP